MDKHFHGYDVAINFAVKSKVPYPKDAKAREKYRLAAAIPFEKYYDDVTILWRKNKENNIDGFEVCGYKFKVQHMELIKLQLGNKNLINVIGSEVLAAFAKIKTKIEVLGISRPPAQSDIIIQRLKDLGVKEPPKKGGWAGLKKRLQKLD